MFLHINDLGNLSTDEVRTHNAISLITDHISAALPNNAAGFHQQVKAAIAIAGLSKLDHVWPSFAWWMLTDGHVGLFKFRPTDQGVLTVIEALVRYIAGETISPDHWHCYSKSAECSGLWQLEEPPKPYSPTAYWEGIGYPADGPDHFKWCAGYASAAIAESMRLFPEAELALDGLRSRFIEYALYCHSYPYEKSYIAQLQRTMLFRLILGQELAG